jgi:hypothetical protein
VKKKYFDINRPIHAERTYFSAIIALIDSSALKPGPGKTNVDPWYMPAIIPITNPVQ